MTLPAPHATSRLTFPASWSDGVRSRLMMAMASALADRGASDTRVADALGRAGASRRSFYRHFDDRDDCVLAAYDAVRADLAALLADADDVTAGIAGVLAYYSDWPALAALATYEIVAFGPRGRRRHETSMTSLAAWLARRQPFATGPHLTASDCAQAAVGAMHRIVSARLASGDASLLPTLTSTLVAVVDGMSDIAPT